jgi:UDPglucose 6-dehydrogenase
MVGKVKGLVGELKGKKIGVLGLAFKPNTDDIRDSPAVYVVERLMEEGATVRAYDPAGMENASRALKVTYCSDAYEAADGCDALVILTEWNQFRKLDMSRIRSLLKSPKLADLRNVYDPRGMREMGFEYVSVGR